MQFALDGVAGFAAIVMPGKCCAISLMENGL
jgi:hypothetical protein